MMKHRQAQQTHKQYRTRRALGLAAAAAAAAVGAIGIAAPAAHARLRINEAFLDAPGTNSTQDFLELRSDAPGGVESVDGLSLILLEGETGAAFGSGSIDYIIPLSGSTGANGLYLRHSFSTGPTPAISPDTGVENLSFGGPPAHENLAVTWIVVRGLTGVKDDDLDTNDDGVLDSTPWTEVIDAVGFVDGDVATDRVYGAHLGGADFNQNAYGAADSDPAVVFRDPNGAWHAGRPTGVVGGPYTVNASVIAQNGYQLTPGNPNNATSTNSRAWIGAAGASFNIGANWTGGAAPSAAGDTALFDGGGATTLTLTADATAGIVSFNGGSHTIAAAGGTLTLDTITGNANVLSHYGNPRIDAPVILNKDTNMRVGRGTVLTFSNLNPNGRAINKQGIGELVLAPGATPGQDVVAATVNITSGSIKFSSDGSMSRVLVANALTMSGTTSRIDLMDNKLITNTPAGTSTAGVYSGVQGMVQKAYNSGAWDGRGVALLTSMPDAGPTIGTTTIGVAPAEAVLSIAPTATGTFAGQPVTGTTTIAMYTYAGDLNLDGRVDAQDYGIIDNWVQFPGTNGYANGDINYDGVIDAADYGIIDNTIQLQGAPIPVNAAGGGGTLSGVAAVPEPTAAFGVALAASALLARRRRRRRAAK